MILEIFDVEHGACALITTSNGRRLLIDCGHNSNTGWQPGTFLKAAGISNLDCLFITNYDEDHVSGYPNLIRNVGINCLIRNGAVAPATIRHLKSEDGMGAGIDALVASIEGTFTAAPAPVDYGDTAFTYYRNSYGTPPFGFDDENNLSLTVFFKCGGHKIVFPGDLEKAGWRSLLANPAFVRELNDVTIFVASHHGRESGYCEEVMKACPNIQVVVISDKKTGYQTQETVPLYRKHASGTQIDGETRRVLTTRRDNTIVFHLPAVGPGTVQLGFCLT